jgi:hypothetical protein
MSTTENAGKQVIKISDILAKLADGVSRKQIAKDLGLSYAAAQKNIFSHPKLKNRKTRPVSDFTLEDDAPDAPVTVAKEEVAIEVTEAAVAVEEVAQVETVEAEVATVDPDAQWRE